MRRPPTLLSLTIASSMICATIPTLAHAGNLEFAAPADDGSALEEAKSLYKEGEVKFQTADYEDALVLWKKTFAILPDGEDTRTMRHALVYNIAEAHRRAYEVSRNPTHLRKAKILLENYRAEHLQLYGDDKDAVRERTEVDDRIAEIDKMLAASEAANEAATPIEEPDVSGGGGTEPAPDPNQPVPQPTPKPLSPNQQWERDIKADPTYGPMYAKGGKQIVSGAVLTSMGSVFALIGAGLVVWGVGLRNDPDPGLIEFNGTGAFVGGAVFGVAGLGMLIPGVLLIVSGSKKRKQVLRDRPKPTGMFVPSLTPRGASFGYTLRF